MDGLYTNRNSLRDFVKNGITSSIHGGTEVYIAVAFFTEPDIIKDMIANNCHVRMIVRLGFPTKPSALLNLMNNHKIELRFYTDPSFHPKLYIFGDKIAFVGSANLTSAAMLTNQEVVVTIPSDDERFSELAILFSNYWEEASVFTEEEFKKYESIYRKHEEAARSIDLIEGDVKRKIGSIAFSNIDRGKQKKSKENIFLDNYRKTYQETFSAFSKIREVYESTGKRKVGASTIPVRLEIDSFLSFVREVHATHETWREQPKGWNENRHNLLMRHIQEWFDTKWPHFEETIIQTNYPLISRVFASADKIDSASVSQILDGLTVLHSFHDRLRFYDSGLETLKQSFIKHNDEQKIKESLKHLLYEKGEIVRRMYDLIYNNFYKLNEFGEANVQELVGWVNKEDLPVVNGRTTKILRYFGFDVKQL